MSHPRLARLAAALSAEVEQGHIPGAVVWVMHRSEVAFFEAFGLQDEHSRAPMQRNSIFRIASMTKPLVGVATMLLMEQGRLSLIDPVSRYLPQLADLRVGVERADADAVTRARSLALEPLQRPITLQDLLRHTAGFTYGPFGDSLVQRLYRDHRLLDEHQSNEEMLNKLTALPLAHQPGSMFEYGMSTDVMGCVIEAVSGMDLNRFITRQIARPLGMADTAFVLNDAQQTRLALPRADPEAINPMAYDALRPPRWYAGGSGLFSTAPDYGRFCQMLLNGGQLDGVRLLSPKSIELMTHNHLPPQAGFGTFTPELGITAPLPAFGQGYGLGVGVRLEAGRSPIPGSIGDFYWGGALGTYFWVDPQQQLAAILMLQELDMSRRTAYRSLLRQLVYQAFD